MIKTATSSLYFTGLKQVEIRTEPIERPEPDEILVEAVASGISAGTEMNVYRGLAPQWRKRQDPLTRLFTDAEIPDWEYPSRYGYASVGRIVELGQNVENLSQGDLVFTYAPHGLHMTVPAVSAVPLGNLPDPELGVFFANLSTAYNGVLDANPPLGANIVVSGLGVIGQLIIQLLAKAGPRTLVGVDTIAARRDLAAAGGATNLLDPTKDKVAEAVRNLTNGKGADVVIEVSGAAPALNEAIRTAGYNGLVIAMSWYGGTFESLSLSGEFHHNRTRVISSQVGSVNPQLGPLWMVERRTEQVKHYLTELELTSLVSHRLPLEAAPEAYELLDNHPEDALQVLFTYGA